MVLTLRKNGKPQVAASLVGDSVPRDFESPHQRDFDEGSSGDELSADQGQLEERGVVRRFTIATNRLPQREVGSGEVVRLRSDRYSQGTGRVPPSRVLKESPRRVRDGDLKGLNPSPSRRSSFDVGLRNFAIGAPNPISAPCQWTPSTRNTSSGNPSPSKWSPHSSLPVLGAPNWSRWTRPRSVSRRHSMPESIWRAPRPLPQASVSIGSPRDASKFEIAGQHTSGDSRLGGPLRFLEAHELRCLWCRAVETWWRSLRTSGFSAPIRTGKSQTSNPWQTSFRALLRICISS